MPSRPGALGQALTGCDLQPVAEVAAAVAEFGQRYLAKIYTPAEQASLRRGGPAALAARFAAKEAVMKLVGIADGIDPRSIEIGSDSDGRPRAALRGRIAEVARDRGIGEIDLSLSHTNELAMAVAVAVNREANAS